MKSGAPARVLQNRGNAIIVLDQQIAGRRTHEHLDAGSTWKPLKLGDVPGVVPRAADPEGKVAMHASRSPAHLVRQSLRAGGERVGVGHLEDRGDTAQHSGARACLQVFLVFQAGLAEMHLAVDHARQDVERATVDDFPGGCLEQVADRRDAALADADVAQTDAVMVGDGAAFQDHVVGGCHDGCARPLPVT